MLKCIDAGMTDVSVEMQTGVPRGTVSHWRRRPVVSKRRSGEIPCGTLHDPSFLPTSDYCYLLGLYLGDGCISRMKRVWRLRVVLDAKYPAIIDECRLAINSVMSGQEAAVLHRADHSVEVSMYSKHWPCLFPQHGPGKKHHRTITLEQWQLQLVAKAPEDLIRGLIHSDGCRVVANDRGVRAFVTTSQISPKIFSGYSLTRSTASRSHGPVPPEGWLPSIGRQQQQGWTSSLGRRRDRRSRI